MTGWLFPRLLEPLAVVVTAVYVAALFWAIDQASYDVWGAMLAAPVVLLGAGLLAASLARRETDPVLGRLVATALALKVVGTLIRYHISLEVYDRADALSYHQAGAAVAERFRQGQLSVEVGEVPGTGFIELVTGVIYTAIGPTMIGGFLVFSLIGFVGLYLFYRAFCRAVPDGDRKRYLLLVLLLPSMLFWPSSIGKESWMIFALGLCACGASQLLTRDRRGVLLLAAGMAATAAVRPHVTLLVFAGLAAGYLFRPGRARSAGGIPGVKLLGLVTLALVGLLVANQAEAFLGIENLSPSTVSDVLAQTEDQTFGGGSKFRAPSIESPLDVPWAVISVLYRPFPWEAHNLQALFTAAEGMLLVGLTLASLSRIAALGRLARRRPYAAFAAVFALLFVVAFSSLGNFGIIVRQRVQAFPLFFVLLCLPLARARAPGGAANDQPGLQMTSPTGPGVGMTRDSASRGSSRSR